MSETGEGLHCLACGSDDLATVDTRAIGQTTRRRKRCKACRRTFYTREFSEVLIPDDARFDGIFMAPAAEDNTRAQ